jgi:hypothetical protein
MELFIHHIQEYKKGLRTLVLHTTKASDRDAIEKRLKREMIDYYIQKVNGTKINVFFGNSICIDVIKQMNFESLSNLTDEEDFILGTMLGYDRVMQCERYLKRKRNGTNNLADSKSISLSQTELIGVVG